jgi:hypothetical protein
MAQSLIALPLKKSGKVIGNFNFTPVRKTFDAEEVELLEKRLKMSLCFEVLKKKFKIKKRKKLFFKVRKDTIPYGGISGNISHGCSTHHVNPSWCQISGLSFQEALGNGWLNAVHGDDKAAIINGGKMQTINEKLMNIVSCALTAKLRGSWGIYS